MLKCEDFSPGDRTAFLGISAEYEPMETVLKPVNAWIDHEAIKVLNVETVSGNCAYSNGSYFVRVWYE
jgi:hypothetical protein